MFRRVVLADDADINGQGVRMALEHEGDEVVAVTGDTEEQPAAVDERLPDGVVTEIRIPPTPTDEETSRSPNQSRASGHRSRRPGSTCRARPRIAIAGGRLVRIGLSPELVVIAIALGGLVARPTFTLLRNAIEEGWVVSARSHGSRLSAVLGAEPVL